MRVEVHSCRLFEELLSLCEIAACQSAGEDHPGRANRADGCTAGYPKVYAIRLQNAILREVDAP